ncbi:MAG: peptide chain release factor 2, partial [Humidesulfovibrio sp.]|nr:peptide chain release factor 2 [Humidesulfovibrio sp.]
MLQFADLKTLGLALLEQYASLWGRLDYDESSERLREIESLLSKPGAWDKPELLTPVLREKSAREFRLNAYDALAQAKADVDDCLVLAQEDQSQEALEALEEYLGTFQLQLGETELSILLSGPDDDSAAILEIHPGAGGVDAQDWAEMLLRMYLRWAESRGFAVVELDRLYGDEAGIKSVTLQITGPYAFGLLKGEAGIHRLIRISPFDASGRRHTAFASVDVYPDIDTNIEIDVKEEDLRIDVFRASGAGGQHVNRTESAVRITHLPSGLVVQCQDEKSQHKNKASAMKVLRSRLLAQEQEKAKAVETDIRRAQVGSGDRSERIRTYNFPQSRVTDHRINLTLYKLDAVMEGDCGDLVQA